jgi:hypothetical protein
MTTLQGCDQSVGSVYDTRLGTTLTTLKKIEGPEWQGVMTSLLRELSFRQISWRKDLPDYLEQVGSFLDGFITGRGVSVTQFEAPDGHKNDLAALMGFYRPRMAFTWERTESAITRWLLELKTNTNDTLAKLERELRTEAARIREEGYRKVERLGAAL